MLNRCRCGAKLYECYNGIRQCRVCSSTYNSKGKLLASRHNWNVEEYFTSVAYKIQLDQ